VISLKKIGVADLYFLTGNEGGQERLIRGNFSTPILFNEDIEQHYGLWSAVIEFIELPNETREAKARISFLFHDNPNSPSHLIKIGSEFKLINNKTIAIGKIKEITYE